MYKLRTSRFKLHISLYLLWPGVGSGRLGTRAHFYDRFGSGIFGPKIEYDRVSEHIICSDADPCLWHCYPPYPLWARFGSSIPKTIQKEQKNRRIVCLSQFSRIIYFLIINILCLAITCVFKNTYMQVSKTWHREQIRVKDYDINRLIFHNKGW